MPSTRSLTAPAPSSASRVPVLARAQPAEDDAGFGVYVHWPFCAAKCPYCDFNSHVRERYNEVRWTAGIAKELESVAVLQGDQRPQVSSIFFGGGTPSLMSGGAVGAVLDSIARLWRGAT